MLIAFLLSRPQLNKIIVICVAHFSGNAYSNKQPAYPNTLK